MNINKNKIFIIPTENTVTFPVKNNSSGLNSRVRTNLAAESRTDTLTTTNRINNIYPKRSNNFLFVKHTSASLIELPSSHLKQGSIRLVLTDITKRCMDIVGALIGLILTLPLWIIIPIFIKLGSPGPVFYTQVRVGRNRRKNDRRNYPKQILKERRNRDRRREDYLGDTFKVIKFRTMVDNAEKESGPIWASKDDPRITGIGKILRKTRFDEIPQFLNILKGDMSLVGPRPERPEFVLDLSGKISGYTDRLKVKPGLTGLAQVENGYDSSMSSVIQKVKYDLEYIKNRSLWMDIKIILKTFKVVITGKGAC